jgi:hypothetical protein
MTFGSQNIYYSDRSGVVKIRAIIASKFKIIDDTNHKALIINGIRRVGSDLPHIRYVDVLIIPTENISKYYRLDWLL